MKKKVFVMRNRIVLFRFALFAAAIAAVFFGVRLFQQPVEASLPAGGSLNPVVGAVVTWTGDKTGTIAANGEPSCTSGDQTATNCDAYTLTVGGTSADWVGKRISVKLTMNPAADYDLVVRKETNGTAGMQGDGLANNTPPLDTSVGTSGNSAGQPEEVIISPATEGVGDYYPRSIYFATNGVQYVGTATVEALSGAAPAGTCALPTYDNYQPPVNTPGTTTPYPRRNSAGEPSIGINWNTGNVMTMHRLLASRTTFDDSTSPPNPAENTGHKWFPRPMPFVVTGLDPIGFTDVVTGRSLFGELSGTFTNGIASDDDLSTFVSLPTQGISPTNSIDHQTIGGGPPSPTAPAGRQPTGAYPHMVYYAAQDIAVATVSASVDGGITYLPAVPAYNLTQCGGLHGHIKVAPDGTVYLPNKGCGGKTGVAVSTDNGLTWTVRTIPSSTAGRTDPSVGIGSGGRIYVGYAGGDNRPHVAVSDDKGLTWRNDFDLGLSDFDPGPGVSPPITASVFPQVVAGDNNRAAVFFLGTTSTNPGNPVGDDTGTAFAGTWYPYIATTCDGGASWSVVRADNDPLFPGVSNPVQQGVVCTNGTTCPAGTRNLLDFNEIVVDSRGRVHAAYADGCNTGHSCMTQPDNSPTLTTKTQNEASARMTIIRQRGGVRLFGAFDAGGPTPPPLPPPVTIRPLRRGRLISWAEPDDGGSPLTAYRIYRGTKTGRETVIAELRPSVYRFLDASARRRDRGAYYYRVTAVNAYGESPRKYIARESYVQRGGE